MNSLLKNLNSHLFPEGYESHAQIPSQEKPVNHKWVQQGHGFVCIGCPTKHTASVSASKYKVDNYNLKRI